MLTNKHFTPVVGLDIHIIVTPVGPVPIPHPFIGIVMDVMDYIPFIGSSVKVNYVPRGICDTSGNILTLVHIPMGGPFLMAPMVGHDSVNFFGSTRVKAENVALSPAGYMLMTCNDVGMPLSLSPGKKMKPVPSLYLPTSYTIPLPLGMPVNVGGPYAPDLLGILKQLAMSYGFGALMKGLGKGLKKLNHLIPKNKYTQGLKKRLCKMGFEPVDLILGRVMYEGIDFELPGILPIRWERNWYSDSSYAGPMGHGMHHSYDLSMEIDTKNVVIVLVLPDGRPVAFPYMIADGDFDYNLEEKLTLTCISADVYELKDHENGLTYTFKKLRTNFFKPVSIRNNTDAFIHLEYDHSHCLVKMIDTAGRILKLTLDKDNRIKTITASHKNEERTLISYAYNDHGDLIAIKDALGQTTSIEHNNHLMVSKTDRNGQTFYWEYDGNKTGARCIHTWGDGGLLEGWISYHEGYNEITNSLKETSLYYYDELNRCIQITDPMGNSTFHEYTELMQPYRDIDEEGNITGYTYDERNNLKTMVRADGSTHTYVHDEKNRLLLTVFPQGNTKVNSYDGELLLSVISEDEQITSFDYNAKGLIEKIRDNKGRYTELYYDEDFNLVKLITPTAAVTEWKYDSWGRCIERINAEGQSESFVYDELNRIKRIHLPDNNTLKLEYNAYEEVVMAVDKTQKVHFEYTPLGNVKTREQNDTKIHYLYNREEQLDAIINEQGAAFRFLRNPKGAIIQEERFDGVQRKYQRDRAGKITKVMRSGDAFTEFEYDLAGRVIRTQYSDGSFETYNYDLNGLLIGASNLNSKIEIKRGSNGRIEKEIQDGYVVESEYDELGNRCFVKSSLGAAVELKYNDAGLVNFIHAKQGNTNWDATLRYNQLGQEMERQMMGVSNFFNYDFAGRIKEQKTSSHSNIRRQKQYEWGVNNKLFRITDLLNNNTTDFEYDKFDDLMQSIGKPFKTENFFRDDVGNIFKSKEKKDRKYDPDGKLITSAENKYSYDEEGNLIKKETPKGEWIYNWGGDGMLSKVTRPDKKDVYFEYDALGRRTAKIFDGKITRWVWDENIPLHEWSYDITERPKIVITELGLLELDKQEPITNLVTWIFDEGTAKPAAKITNDQSYSIITDYLGTPVEAYDQRGEKVWSCELNAYGKINKMEGLGSFIPFRYQGQYADEETGLFYNRFRYFSPQDDCYLTQDPIGIKGGLRLYGYVHDPNWWLDIFGLTGTYYFTDGNTSYIGKGPKDRFYTSMKGRVNGSGNVTQGVHHDFGSNDVGLMVEAELMDRHNAVTDPNFHNAINSPGKKMLDDLKINNPTAHADIIKKANDIQADFNAANGIVCK